MKRKKMRYDKLIRDRIPEIMEENGKKYVVRRTNDPIEFSSYLHKKLLEEVNEFLEKPSIDELADIQEIILALTQDLGHTRSRLELTREAKVIERGGFEDKWILEEVS